MGVLSDVLAYKAQKEAKEMADVTLIPNAVNTFITTRQNAQDSLLKNIQMQMAVNKYPLEIQQLQGEVSKTPFEIQKLQAETKKAGAESSMLDTFMQGGQSGQFAIPEMTVGGAKVVNVPVQQQIEKQQQEIKDQLDLEHEKQKKMIVGEGAESGKISLAQESIKNIEDIKNTLFPDGTPESFDRNVAFGSNLPGVDVPLLGRITPRAVPFGEKGQQVARKMGTALAARQLIQTGVAARPEETANLFNQFAPNVFSNPKASWDALNQLQDFYKTYLDKASPGRADKSITRNSDKSSTEIPDKFSPSVEKDIQDSMKHYKKSRSEVVNAMKKQGLL